MPPPAAPKEPQVYQVYRGNISNTMDFGVFLTLPQFGRKEGLLHISQVLLHSITARLRRY
jgi:predicted RNA-binding protein with RPS1 domain